MSIYLNQIGLPKKSYYVDTGVILPFFYWDAPELVKLTTWFNSLSEMASADKFHTTTLVRSEVNTGVKRMHLRQRNRSTRHNNQTTSILKSLLERKITVKDVYVNHLEKDDRLSTADLSLLHREDQDITLLTSDRALYERDQNAILLVCHLNEEGLSWCGKD